MAALRSDIGSSEYPEHIPKTREYLGLSCQAEVRARAARGGVTLLSPPRVPVGNQDGLRLIGIRNRTVRVKDSTLCRKNAARLIGSYEIAEMSIPIGVLSRERDNDTRAWRAFYGWAAIRKTTEALHRDNRERLALGTKEERAHTRRRVGTLHHESCVGACGPTQAWLHVVVVEP